MLLRNTLTDLRPGHDFIRQSKHTEAALSRRSAVLDAITYAARRIIGAADWQPAMPELLARLGTATQVKSCLPVRDLSGDRRSRHGSILPLHVVGSRGPSAE